MLGDFITRGLILVLGYAYPAFECFKTVEKNRVEIEELRFWCQYWIIVAVLTVFERVGDIFVSWLPMYGEMKLALFIYMWYPKTKGTGYVYETLLRPYVSRHEPDIDRNLQELRARLWDLALYYYQNCTNLGQTAFFQVVQYVAAQSGRFSKTNNEERNNGPKKPVQKNESHYQTAAAPPPSPSGSPSFQIMANKRKQASDRRRPPRPPLSPSNSFRSMAQQPKSDAVQVHLHGQAEYIHSQEVPEPADSTSDESETGVEHRLHAAGLKLRRSKGFH